MKQLISLFLCVTLSIFSLTADAGYVKGYYRKDGTYVAPHYRKDKTIPVKDSASSAKANKPSKVKPSATPKMPKSYKIYQQRQEARTFPKAMRQKKYDEQDGFCAHCGKHCDSVSEMDGDHIVPYSKGGKTEYSNLQMLCPHCNRSKGNRFDY